MFPTGGERCASMSHASAHRFERWIHIYIYVYATPPTPPGTYLFVACPLFVHLGLEGKISQLGLGPNKTTTKDLSSKTRTKLGLDDPPLIL